MLDSLDTLIAFAVIFAVVSLLITIVVQMISSALNLRGRNLAWGIAEAFEAINPELSKTVQASAGTRYEKFMGWLKSLPRKFLPAKSPAKGLADHCLNDTLLSDFQFAGMHWSGSAVRADELFALLHRIATGKKPGTPPEIQADVIALVQEEPPKVHPAQRMAVQRSPHRHTGPGMGFSKESAGHPRRRKGFWRLRPSILPVGTIFPASAKASAAPVGFAEVSTRASQVPDALLARPKIHPRPISSEKMSNFDH